MIKKPCIISYHFIKCDTLFMIAKLCPLSMFMKAGPGVINSDCFLSIVCPTLVVFNTVFWCYSTFCCCKVSDIQALLYFCLKELFGYYSFMV